MTFTLASLVYFLYVYFFDRLIGTISQRVIGD